MNAVSRYVQVFNAGKSFRRAAKSTGWPGLTPLGGGTACASPSADDSRGGETRVAASPAPVLSRKFRLCIIAPS